MHTYNRDMLLRNEPSSICAFKTALSVSLHLPNRRWWGCNAIELARDVHDFQGFMRDHASRWHLMIPTYLFREQSIELSTSMVSAGAYNLSRIIDVFYL